MTDLITTDSKKKNRQLMNSTQGGELVPSSSKLPVRATSGALALAGAGVAIAGMWLWGGILATVGSLWFLSTWFKKAPNSLSAPVSVIQEPYFKEIKRAIAKARFQEHIDKEGEAAESLAEGMFARWKTFEKLIGEKFEPGELTFQRYWETAEATLRAHFENLKIVSDQLSQLSLSRATSSPMGEAGSVRTELESGVRGRLELAEKTLVSFDRLASELAKLETSRAQSASHLDDTLKELQELANRAQKYSHSSVRTIE